MGFFSKIFKKVLRFEDSIINKASGGILPGGINMNAYNYAKNFVSPTQPKAAEPAPVQQYEPPVFHFPEIQMPAAPEPPVLPDMPQQTYIPPIQYDYEAEAAAKKNEADIKKRNALRRGRRSLIATSPLGVTEEATVKKPLLGT